MQEDVTLTPMEQLNSVVTGLRDSLSAANLANAFSDEKKEEVQLAESVLSSAKVARDDAVSSQEEANENVNMALDAGIEVFKSLKR